MNFDKILAKFSGKKILILGMGKEGQSTFDFFKKNVPYCELFTADEKTDALPQKELSQIKFDFIFKTPGISVEKLARFKLQFTKLYSNTQLFFDLVQWSSPTSLIIGVTGTKGKTTITSLIHHVLKQADKKVFLGGNIGVPALNLLDQPATAASIYVLELSAHQLAELESSPNIAVIAEISPDHLDYYPHMEAYVQAKSQISRYQSSTDISYYYAESPLAQKIAALSLGKKQPFAYRQNSDLVKLIKDSQPQFFGQHNIVNALPAVLIAQRLGIEETTIKKAIHSFQPVEHRLELVRELSGVKYYNDSAANAPSAAIAALKTFAGQSLILITGGLDRNLDLSALAQEILHSQIKYLLLFPDNGQKILELIKKLQPKSSILENYQLVKSMPEAVEVAQKKAQLGDIVLLSPGSASFNLFKNYEDRGRQFKTAVQTLVPLPSQLKP